MPAHCNPLQPLPDGFPDPRARKLQRLVGSWSYEVEDEAASESGTPDQGEEVVRSVDGLWVIAEGVSRSATGATHASVMTLGFDPLTRRIVGTNIGMGFPTSGSSMAHSLRTAPCSPREPGPALQREGETTKYLDRIGLLDEDPRVTHIY